MSIPNHLHVVCYDGEIDTVKKLLRSREWKAQVDKKDKNGWTPLHCAASRGRLKVCKLLIQAGADVAAKNGDGSSGLHYLARITNPESKKLFHEVLKMMKKKGAQVNVTNLHNETPLHQAAMKGSVLAVEFLVGAGADVNKQNEFGETPLHYAVRLGNKDIVGLLLDHEADCFIEGDREGSAKQLAEMSGQTEILELINVSKSFREHQQKYGSRLALTRDSQSRPVPVTQTYHNMSESSEISLSQSSSISVASSSAPSPTNVAFGTLRGKCNSQGCDCDMYIAESDQGGQCRNCGDFPATHENLGKVGEASDSSAQQSETASVNDTDDEMKTLEKGINSLAATEMQHSWEIQGSELKFDKKLGEGTAAKVFKGHYRGQAVAIKVLKESLDAVQMADFQKEFQIYSALRSPHVVLFFGACLKPELCMVFELCSKGALFDVLNEPAEFIDWKTVIKMSLDIARALNTLHSWVPPIVHRDMKSLNLLVDDNWMVKVTDFGLSRFASGVGANMATLGKLRGTYAYSAPEVYFGEAFTTKADVYSVGVIFWELAMRCLTGEYCMPYSEYPELVFDFQIIIQVAKNKKRPTIPDRCPPPFKDLIRSCWAQDPAERPEIIDVVPLLEQMQVHQKQHKKEWNDTMAFGVNPE